MNVNINSVNGNFIFEDVTVSYLESPTSKRFNQYPLEVSEGRLFTKELSSFSVIYNSIFLKSVDKSIGESFRVFLRENLFFDAIKFDIVCSGNLCGGTFDLGLGDSLNPSVTNCHLSTKSTTGIFKFKEPGLYDIKIPYFFKEV